MQAATKQYAATKLPLAGGPLTGALVGPSVASRINGIVNASQVFVPGVTGPDIAQQVNQAFLNLQASLTDHSVGTVYVPYGNYTTSHTINIITGKVNTGYRQALVCEPGTTITYTGSGDAVFAAPTNVAPGNIQESNLRIVDCDIIGNSTATNGMHFQGTYGLYLEGNRVSTFNKSGAAGYFFDGSGLATAINDNATSDDIGVLTAGNSTFGTAANSIHWIGGTFESDATWAWQDSAVAQSSEGYDFDIVIDGATFEGNGTIGKTLSGDILVQNSLNFAIENNYLEVSRGGYQILLDGTATPGLGVIKVIGNELDNPGAANANIAATGIINEVDVEQNNVFVGGASFVNATSTFVHVFEANNRPANLDAGTGVFTYLNKQVATLTTTAASSDTILNVPGIERTGILCTATPTNSSAAAMTGVYVSPTTTVGQVTVNHPATAGATFAIFCGTGTY
jgi:uncharacterized protein YaiE (UPF0345 family)